MNSDIKNSGTSDDGSMDKKFVAKNSVNLAKTNLHSAAHGFATEAICRFFIEEQNGCFSYKDQDKLFQAIDDCPCYYALMQTSILQ